MGVTLGLQAGKKWMSGMSQSAIVHAMPPCMPMPSSPSGRKRPGFIACGGLRNGSTSRAEVTSSGTATAPRDPALTAAATKHTMADLGGDAAAAEDEGDLYGDLDAVPLAKKAAPSTASDSTAGTASATSGTPGAMTLHGIGKVYDEAAMQQLRADNDRLRAENEALKRNIGTLYRTAKAELARKDERIASLQGQVDSTM